MNDNVENSSVKEVPWWRGLGPTLITACLVLGAGSLLVSSNIGANYGCELIWFFVATGILMAGFVIMGMRIGVVGGATPCTLIAERLGRPVAAVIGINLCLITATFQFANNLAAATAIRTFIAIPPQLILVIINVAIIIMLFTTTKVYSLLERIIKVVVGLIIFCFVANLIAAKPDIMAILKGFVPSVPDGISLGLPEKVDGKIYDPLILIASMIGTTFSLGGAFYQGNLVREKGWEIKDCKKGVIDSILGISVLTGISIVFMVTAATVIPGKPATDLGVLANTLEPLLGVWAYRIFCIGLLCVAMNPFMINAMIGGSILADGLGKPAKLSDPWSKRFTAAVMLVGMTIAIVILSIKIDGKALSPIRLIIFGQALTVLGCPLMACSILWLANRKDIMGDKRNSVLMNILGAIGLAVVFAMSARVIYLLVLRFN